MTALAAKGTLAETPLLHLMVQALDRQLSGTLVLEDASQRRHAVYFSRGVPTTARAAEPVALFGQILIELGKVTAATVEEALERSRAARRLLGSVLLEQGAIDQGALEAALLVQLERTLAHFHALPLETVFGYYDGTNYLERYPAIDRSRIAPLSLLWRVARTSSRHVEPLELGKRLGPRTLRLHPEAPLTGFGFDGRVQAVLDVLRAKPQPWPELVGRQLVDAATLARLVDVLSLLGHLDLPGSRPPILAESGVRPSHRPASDPARVSSVPVPPATPPAAVPLAPRTPAFARPPQREATPGSAFRPPGTDAAALRAEIERRAALSSPTHYEVLGVAPDAPAAAIQAAYFQLARTWHPDRLHPELADLRDAVTRVFARMGEAHQVLGDPEQRRAYDASLKGNADTADEQAQVQRVLRAATAYQKALVLLKRNQAEAAEREARQAAQDDPEQADYVALLAWIESMKPEANLGALIGALNRAVDMEENNLRVRWYRGLLQKRIGNDNRAYQDFRFILEHDPKHVDAQREIRLYDMRRPKGKSDPPRRTPTSRPPASKSDKLGVLGRLFKKH